MSKQTTLGDFLATCDYPLVHVASAGAPRAQAIAYFADGGGEWLSDGGFDDLEGTVDADGWWHWGGEGDPTFGGTVVLVQAYSDEAEWREQRADYLAEAGYVECAYCGRDVDTADLPDDPKHYDADDWAHAAREHKAGCEWVETRAFTTFSDEARGA